MKIFLLVLGAFSMTFGLIAFRVSENKEKLTALNIEEYKRQRIVRCSPDWNYLASWLEETDIPPIPGAGIYKWKITTSNDSAQFYFNQGINMYYSFHLIEAMASFKKASRFDPNSAILYWAQALTYGPNINDYGYRASPEALEAVDKAKNSASTASPMEKELIDAMSVRYTADSTDASRESLNQQYTEMMERVSKNYPSNADALALYADAMMLQHPWDLWKTDGTPKPWTPHIREVLEKVLKLDPMHPGANHYYIHVMEPSPYAALALPSAERLGKTNPGLSHVVHMPSHIYLRTGNYQKGIDVNISAVNSYYKSIPLYAAVTGNDFIYIIHNLHMKTNHALMNGQSAVAKASADETRKSIPLDYLDIPAPVGNVLQYIYMTPVLTQIRYGKWDEILKNETPNKSHIYVNVLHHFGRGMAYAKKKNFDKAAEELDAMREFMKDSSLEIPMSPFSSAIEGARVAEQILLGVIHEERNMMDGAIRHYAMADSIEIAMVYNEPRDWLLSPKHYLGNAFLKTGKLKDAERIYNADLKYNSENGWSLYGLHKTYTAQKRTSEAAKVLTRFTKSCNKADIKIKASVY